MASASAPPHTVATVMSGLRQRLSHQLDAAGLAEPGEQHRDGLHRRPGRPSIGPDRARHDRRNRAWPDRASPWRSTPARASRWITGRAPSADTSSTVELTADGVAACGEDFERGDDVERIEAVEQHELRVHRRHRVRRPRCTASGQNATLQRNLAIGCYRPVMHTVAVLAHARHHRVRPRHAGRGLRPRRVGLGAARLPGAGVRHRSRWSPPEPLRIGTDHGLDALAAADTIVVPGRNDVTVRAAARGDRRRCATPIARGARIASICTGAFTLAAAGSARRQTGDDALGWPPTPSAPPSPPCALTPTCSTSTKARC